MKKILIIVLIVIAVIAAGIFIFLKYRKTDTPQKKTVSDTFTVKKGDIFQKITTTGYAVANQEVEIKCKASGEAVKAPFDISDTVKKGDLLLELDPQDEELNVKQKEVSLKAAQTRLEQAKLNLQIAEQDLITEKKKAEANLKSAEAAAKDASAKADRIKQLWEKKLVSQEEYETAATSSVKARTDLENARIRIEELKTLEYTVALKRQALEQIKAEIETNNIALQEAKDRLEDTRVYSPMDGVISERNIQIGQIIASAISNVGGGTAVFTLMDLSRMYIYAAVDESDIGKVRLDQRAEITVDAHPGRVFTGTVVRIGTKGKNVSNVITYEVRIEVKRGNIRLLKPEMSADVNIIIAQKEDVLIVPVTAVKKRRDKGVVMMHKPEGKPEPRPVETGVQDMDHIEIISGLAEGDVIKAKVEQTSSKWKKDREGNTNDRRRRGFIPGARGPRRRMF
jgi:RND family efflux transporter MFP subunit